MERRIGQARFAESTTLEEAHWKFNPRAFDRPHIEELATAGFIHRRANLLLVGGSGVSVTHIIRVPALLSLREVSHQGEE